MSGAAVLSALGALRGGAGLVRVCCPRSIQPIVAASEPCLMSVALDEDPEGRIAFDSAIRQIDLDWPTVLAVGPGLGQGRSLADLVRHLLVNFPGPIVIDADGLNNLATACPAEIWTVRAGRQTIITPHPGEMARLRQAANLPLIGGDDDDTRLKVAHEYARLTGLTVVLKGYHTVVCTPELAYVNQTGNPGMATGGMGDVLTGLLAALFAQGLTAFDAARLGVYCHGLAADHCKRQIGPVGYLARDVATELPAALAEASRPHIGFK